MKPYIWMREWAGYFCKLLRSGQEWTVLAAAGCQGPPDAVVTASAKL